MKGLLCVMLKLWRARLRSSGELRISKGFEFLAPPGRELGGLKGIALPLPELRLYIGVRRIGWEKDRSVAEMGLRRESRSQRTRALEKLSSRSYVRLVDGCLGGSR